MEQSGVADRVTMEMLANEDGNVDDEPSVIRTMAGRNKSNLAQARKDKS